MDPNQNNQLTDQQRLEKEFQEQQEKLRAAEAARIKAEAEKEAMEKFLMQKEQMQTQTSQTQQQQTQWTEEQWQKFEEETGMTRQQLMIVDNLTRSNIEALKAELDKKLKEAEERARQAEEKLSRFSSTSQYEKEKAHLFKTRPELEAYEKDIDAFLSDYPDDTKRDPEKLRQLLERAVVYVKGKVGGELMATKKSKSTGFSRSEDEVLDDNETIEVDTSNLRSAEALTISKIVPKKEELDTLKKYQHDLKGADGIMVSMEDEFKAVESKFKKGV